MRQLHIVSDSLVKRPIGRRRMEAAPSGARGWQRLRRAAALPCAGLSLLLAGCGVYLHDPELAKSTAKLADDSKQAAAALHAALKGERDNYAAYVETEMKAIGAYERSRRDLAVANLMLINDGQTTGMSCDAAPGADGLTFRGRLQSWTTCRQLAIAGVARLRHGKWSEQELKDLRLVETLASVRSNVEVRAAGYERITGSSFPGCRDFPVTPPAGTPADHLAIYETLAGACDQVAALENAVDKRTPAVAAFKRAVHDYRLAGGTVVETCAGVPGALPPTASADLAAAHAKVVAACAAIAAIDAERPSYQKKADELASAAKEYRDRGGRFVDCAGLQSSTAGRASPAQAEARRKLEDACGKLGTGEAQLMTGRTSVAFLESIASDKSELGKLRSSHVKLRQQVDAVDAERTAVGAELDKLKKRLEAARAKTDNAAAVTAAFEALAKRLELADSIASGVSAPSLGERLAKIEFRQANLRDVLVALAAPAKDGTDEAKAASQVFARKLAGVLTGLQDLAVLSDDSRAPSVAALTVAYAQQNGLAGAIRAELGALEQRLRLADVGGEALAREYGMLDQVLTALDRMAGCNAADFDTLWRQCPADRRTATRALLVFAESMAVGRASSRMANVRDTQVQRERGLRVAEENAATRLQIITLATDEMAAYGAGGVQVETLLNFLQAVGVGFIAKGVN